MKRSGFHYSPHPALQPRPDYQETAVHPLKNPENWSKEGQHADGSQNRYGSPHSGKGGGARDDRLAALLGMEALHQLVGAYRATGAALYAHEVDCLPSVEPAHQTNFSDAQRTVIVVPHGDLGIVFFAHQS